MSRINTRMVDYYINLLKSKILSEEDIVEICKEFKLETPNFTNSHDWIFGLMSREIVDKGNEQKLKIYLNKFPINNGLDLKELKKQINLSGNKKNKEDRSLQGWSDIILGNPERTPEQQKHDMFKTMNDAAEKETGKREVFEGITFEELQNDIIKRGGSEADRILKMRKQHEETMKELCNLCGKSHKEHDGRGFIYFVSEDNLKAGWSCVEELVRKIRK